MDDDIQAIEPNGTVSQSTVTSGAQAQDGDNSARAAQQPQQSKYAQLLAVIEDMGKDIRPTYAGSKSSAERLKRGIVHARILVRECLLETERKTVMPAKVTSVGGWDTKLYADSVECVPIDSNITYFVCGTYQLLENSAEKERIGRITLHKTDFKDTCLDPLDMLETSGVLDLKFNRKLSEEAPLILTSANASGCLALYSVNLETQTIRPISSQTVVDDGLALACDWSHHSTASVVVSDSKGCISLLHYNEQQIEIVKTWKAHDYEAWTTAFDPFDEHLIYSGGDDCLWRGWDTRTDTAVFTNRRHEMGVTSIQGSTKHAQIIATGSYDEQLRLWDIRRLTAPLVQVGVGGGIWRVKWAPYDENYLLVGAMHNGFHIVHFDPDKPHLTLDASFMEHGSLAYGCDWSWQTSLCAGKRGLASCSFYDHLLKTWTWEC